MNSSVNKNVSKPVYHFIKVNMIIHKFIQLLKSAVNFVFIYTLIKLFFNININIYNNSQT